MTDDWWNVWNIPFTELADVNMANVKSIAIGFGDGDAPYVTTGTGTVYFDDIILGDGDASVSGSPSTDVNLTEDPFMYGWDHYPLLLKPDCPLIEAGGGYVDEYSLLKSKTTDFNGVPDCNIADIGFHYFDWSHINVSDGNLLNADLNRDRIVNFSDFAILAAGWLISYDIDNLSIMADKWMGTFSLEVTLNQDPNLVSNVLEVVLADAYDDITYCLLMDGQYLGRFCGGSIAIPTYEYCNGLHELKVVGIDLDSEVLVGPVINITVNNRLFCLTASDTYEYSKAYRFAGFYEPNEGSTISFEIKDLNDDIIWTNSSSGNFNFEVPAGVLQSPYNELIIQEAGGEGGGTADWIKEITKKFDTTSDPNDANGRSLLVSPQGKFTESRKDAWKEFLNTCKKRGRSPTICLFGEQATRKNIETALKQSGVTLVYIISDGNRDVYRIWPPSKIHRTFFNTSDGPYFSCLSRNIDSPGAEELLPEKYEGGYSIWDLKSYFQQRERMYVVIDACKNGTSVMDPMLYINDCGARPQDNNYSFAEYEQTADMAKAFDIWGDSGNRIYMGWRRVVFAKNVLWYRYTTFLKQFWCCVGNGQSFETAISTAAQYSGDSCIAYVDLSWVGNTAIIVY